MEALWAVFKPTVAENARQLAAYLRVEELADRFDALRWTLGATFKEIYMLGESLAEMYNRTEPMDMLFDEQLEVSQRIPKPTKYTHHIRA